MTLSSAAIRAVLLASLLVPTSQAVEYGFMVEPSYSPEQTAQVYTPLLAYLRKVTGHRFTLIAPRNYHFYWRDIRQNAKTDFAYAEAHFTEYRVNRFKFEPLARTAEPSSYALLADAQYADGGLNGMVGLRIASMPSPSLGFSLLAEMFKNPISQPEFNSEAASWKDGVEMVFSGDAEAAIVPMFIAQQYPNLIEIAKSREFSGTAVSASPDVPTDVKQAVKDALLKLADDPEAFTLLTELGASKFVETSAADYTGAEAALSGFFGYTPP